jgi:hypothetical protein
VNGYFKLAILAAALALGAGAGWWFTADHFEGELARVSQQNTQYKLDLANESNAVQQAAAQAAQKAQQYWEAQFAAHDAQLQQERHDEIIRRDATIDQLRAGKQRMYVDAKVACPAGGGGRAVPGASAGSGLGYATARVELSPTYGIAFESIADDADAVADQLREAQQILMDERKGTTSGVTP